MYTCIYTHIHARTHTVRTVTQGGRERCTYKAGSITKYKRSAIGHRLARRQWRNPRGARRTSLLSRAAKGQQDYYGVRERECYREIRETRPRVRSASLAVVRLVRMLQYTHFFRGNLCARCTRGRKEVEQRRIKAMIYRRNDI